MVCLPQLKEAPNSKHSNSNSNLTEHIYCACEWHVKSFDSLVSDLYHISIEMKITSNLLFFNFHKCVQKL
jgi:hypothetical protein